MASSLLSLALLVLLSCLSPSSSSRSLLVHQSKLETGFRVTLNHVDSGKNLTKFERLRRGMKRGRERLKRLTASSSSSSDIEAPVFAGNGEFLMKLSIGSPPQSFSAIMDTGSDLIWTQCKPCRHCFDQSTPVFDPSQSSTFSRLPCSSNLCAALPSSKCNKDGCEYLYAYGDSSTTQGVLASETFTFGDSSGDAILGIGFGCGEDNEGDGFDQGAGLVGLGRGPLSLVSQLNEPKFSYCLTSIDESKSSTLLIGSTAAVSGEIKTTPLIKNPMHPSFYYLSLEGISVGSTLLPIASSTFELDDSGSGGLIIDSGTTITYLEDSAFQILRREFISQTKLPVDKSGSTGLDLCFTLPSDATKVEVPKLTFHFTGADLELPGENYMIGDSSVGLLCLAMGSSNGMSILGNFQQQNLIVLHDLAEETLSFVPANCDKHGR